MLLPAARRLAERYFELTGVVQRIREVSRRGVCFLSTAAPPFFCTSAAVA